MLAAGVGILIAASLAAVAFWWRSPILFGLVAVVVAASSWMALRPPVVVRLDESGYRARVRFSSGRFEGRWSDVAEAELVEGLLVLTTDAGPKCSHDSPVGCPGCRRAALGGLRRRRGDVA